MQNVSTRTIGRLCIYRRLLSRLKDEGKTSVYSHELAALSGGSAALVRRDLMAIGYSGTPYHGYVIENLLSSMAAFLDDPQGQQVALVGLGNLGRALLAYFSGRRPHLAITAAFDIDPAKVNRVMHGCRCHAVVRLVEVVREKGIQVGVICVPALQAQSIADQLVTGGVRAVLNFAPIRLHLPDGIYVEDLDMTTALEKAAYFARKKSNQNKENRLD